jgi:hypothetical protein
MRVTLPGIAKTFCASLCFVFAFVACGVAIAQLNAPASQERRGWPLVVLSFAACMLAIWLGSWFLGGRNPLGRCPESVLTTRPRRLVVARVALGYAVLAYVFMALSSPSRRDAPIWSHWRGSFC